MRGKRLWVVIPVALVALLAVFALVGALARNAGEGDDSRATTYGNVERSVYDGDESTVAGAAPDQALGQAKEALDAGGSAEDGGTGEGVYADMLPATFPGAHYLIRNGSITLTVKRHELRPAMQRVGAITLGMGGYVLSSFVGSETAWYGGAEPLADDASGAATGLEYDETRSSQNIGGQTDVLQYGTVTVRVPEARFDAAVERFAKLGEVVDLTTSAEDVSAQMVDLRARLRHAKAVEKRLLGFLDQARTIKETLAVQDRIDQTQLRVEQLSAEVARLGEVTSYGTITVSMHEHGVPQPGAIDESDSFWGAFTNSLGLIADGAKASAVALGALLPFLALAAVAGVVAYYARRAILRRRSSRTPQAPQAPATQS